MMQAFRSAAKPVIIVVTVSFFVWLVYDLSGLGGSQSIFTRTSVGKVNGQRVDARVFEQQVQNEITDEQRRTGHSLSLDEVSEVRDRVWEQFVRQILYQREYGQRGIRVTTDEVVELIRNVPAPTLARLPELQTDGKFDPEKYQRWLNSTVGQSMIPLLEMQYRDELLQSKLFRSVVADVYLSDGTLWERYRDEKETVKVGLAHIDPAATVTDAAAPVSDAEAEAYFRQHQDEFKRSRAAYLSYVMLDRRPDASDTAAARARARTLREEILKGTPFEEVAKRESADTMSGKAGGDLGAMNRKQVDAAFADAAMKLPLNTVSEPVLSPFGYHLIKVDSRKGDSLKAHHLLVRIELAGAHRDLVDAQADSLEQLAAEKLDRAALDTAARALHLQVHRVGPTSEGSRLVVPEGGVVPDAGVWAFQAKPGGHSTVIEGPTAFYVFRLDSLHPQGVPPYSAVKSEVEARVRLGKKKTEARRLAENLAQQIARGTPLSQATKTLGFEYREVGSFSRLTSPLQSAVLIGAAFSVKKGETAGPIETDEGFYLIQVLEHTPADSAEFTKNLAAIRSQATEAARRSRVQYFMTALRAAAKVVDNRAEVYQANARQTAAQ